MSPSVKKINSGNMAYRNNQNRNRNFAGNYGGGSMGANRMNLSPWENQNFGGGNMPGGQNMNAQVINLANNLLSNLCRNQNPPSLLDLPRGGGGGGGGMGNRNQRGGPMSNRGSGGGGNRRPGFQNRGSSGGKAAQKQGPGAGGITKPNSFDRAKKLLAKNSSSPGGKKKESGKRTEKVESPYAEVPNERFYCHLCKKHMWDAESFENHIKGRNHLMMREGIEESYRIKANMIRQEVKMAEQMKSIEMYRLKSKNRNLDYCTMCDLNFHGHISAHRKSDGHLQLKKFLHPKCLECNKEFPTRIDYDSHLLSPDHLKKAAEKNTKVGEQKLIGLQVITEDEELKDVRPPQKKRKKIAKKSEGEGGSSAEGGAEVKKEGEEGAEGDEAEQKEGEDAEQKEADGEAADESKEGDDLNDTQGEGEEEEVALPVDPENCILDFEEGDEVPVEVDTRLPKYNWTRPVGIKLISKLDCFECKLCGKFFDNDKTAEVHARTVTHHRNFVKLINEKSSDTKIAEKRAAAAVAAQERKKRKIEEDEKAAAGGEEAGEAKEGANGNAGGEGGDGELYDPSEAAGEGEAEGDVEMEENGEEGEGEEGGEEGEGEEGGEGEEDGEGEEKMEDEPVAEPEPVKVEPAKVEPAKTPVKTAAAAAPVEESPAKKATPAARGGAAAKGTPRGRGRGRYTRY